MRPLPVLAALLLTTAPAAAQTVTHSLEGRFGVAYESGDPRGTSNTRAVSEGVYTMNIRHPFDNGWSLGVSVSVEAGNLVRRGPRARQTPQPGLRLTAPGS